MKNSVLLLSFVCLTLFACNFSKEKEMKLVQTKLAQCEASIIESQEQNLERLSSLIVAEKPKLYKTEIDTMALDEAFIQEIETLFESICPEVLALEAFEKFAFVYWYNLKYTEIRCCSPHTTEIIGSSFFDLKPYDAKDIYSITLAYLFEKNDRTKKDVSGNGFSLTDVYFYKSREKFIENDSIHKFVVEIDSLFEQSYLEDENE